MICCQLWRPHHSSKQRNVSLNYSPSSLHHHLVRKFCHGPTKTIILVFFVFGALPKIQTIALRIHILALDNLIQQMKHSGKLNNFSSFVSYHSMCQLCINSLLATKYMCFPILGMLANLGVKPIPFLHIKPHILHNFLMTCMLTKGIPLSYKYFVFPSYLKPCI